MTLMIVVAISLLLLSAVLLAGMLVRHERWMTFIALAGILFEAEWILLSLLRRTTLPKVSLDMAYLLGGIVLAIAAAVYFRHFRLPNETESTPYTREITVAAVTFLVLAASILVWQYNGYNNEGSWVFHGFLNGDTLTLSALVERSLHTDTLVTQNPFAANGYLEYPTVFHGAMADFIEVAGIARNWQRYLPLITYIQILITVPIFFLLWDVLIPEPAAKKERWFNFQKHRPVYWLQAVVVLWVLALSWDNYIYPQSHFFLTGIFLTLVALLMKSYAAKRKEQLAYVGLCTILGLILLLSNAVTGTAAVAVIASWYSLRMLDNKRSMSERSIFGLLIVAWGVVFLLFSAGDPAFGRPQFSYTATYDMLRLALPMVLIAAASLVSFRRFPYPATAVTTLMFFAFVVFFFSTRDIVIENASRFLYHAVLVGFVLLLEPAGKLWHWLRERRLPQARSLAEKGIITAVFCLGLIFMMLPSLASMASAHDNLMFQDERAVYFGTLRAMEWIEDNTEPNAVFITTPHPPWSIPFFTGRSIIRAEDFWLSPQDDALKNLKTAYNGSEEMQEKLKGEHAYLMLFISDLERWNMQEENAEFKNINVAIFRLGE